ncbi:hypothetical protein [Sulfurimonas sp.]|uniref:hypothetical protein n=1 Tax=Sulfurimonas sp. TaxID=2022749 RepID=UPI0026398E7D|nr:hypothetical protein [Sulfurimonas sp.]
MKLKIYSFAPLFLGGAIFLLCGCGTNSTSDNNDNVISSNISYYTLDDANGYDIRNRNVLHSTAYIAQMCYTKTIDKDNITHNPCFACHNKNIAPNYIFNNDTLQELYDFPSPALKNPFLNHFKDFSNAVVQISDETIQNYIQTSNYFDENNSIILAKKLQNLTPLWDDNDDGIWSGYIPDCYYNFDDEGFDKKTDGSYSGWRAFGYMPFLGTFWPTNGSTDDVLIRLNSSFMKLDENGSFNKEVYKLNLAIVEAMIKRKDVAIDTVDETRYGVDLDKNGELSSASIIKYKWDPKDGMLMYYIGYANELLKKEKLHIAAGLFPEGTEFLHSVRYIQADNNSSEISLSQRMKELRYAKKTMWLTYADLQNIGMAKIVKKDLDPDAIEGFRGNFESGLGNNLGWVYQGFIEDKNGNLRPQSYEETLNCMGCHSGITATVDSIFSFARKFDTQESFQQGWYHWSQKSLKGIAEMQYSDGRYEFSNYLRLNNSGDEFRENDEVITKFFLANGDFNQSAITILHNDISYLLYPSYKRAIKLNKAYKALVETQTFYNGKAAHILPFKNIYQKLEDLQSTGNEKYIIPE